jgi:hypothetical protein
MICRIGHIHEPNPDFFRMCLHATRRISSKKTKQPMNVRIVAHAICIVVLIFSNQLLADVNVLSQDLVESKGVIAI